MEVGEMPLSVSSNANLPDHHTCMEPTAPASAVPVSFSSGTKPAAIPPDSTRRASAPQPAAEQQTSVSEPQPEAPPAPKTKKSPTRVRARGHTVWDHYIKWGSPAEEPAAEGSGGSSARVDSPLDDSMTLDGQGHPAFSAEPATSPSWGATNPGTGFHGSFSPLPSPRTIPVRSGHLSPNMAQLHDREEIPPVPPLPAHMLPSQDTSRNTSSEHLGKGAASPATPTLRPSSRSSRTRNFSVGSGAKASALCGLGVHQDDDDAAVVVDNLRYRRRIAHAEIDKPLHRLKKETEIEHLDKLLSEVPASPPADNLGPTEKLLRFLNEQGWGNDSELYPSEAKKRVSTTFATNRANRHTTVISIDEKRFNHTETLLQFLSSTDPGGQLRLPSLELQHPDPLSAAATPTSLLTPTFSNWSHPSASVQSSGACLPSTPRLVSHGTLGVVQSVPMTPLTALPPSLPSPAPATPTTPQDSDSLHNPPPRGSEEEDRAGARAKVDPLNDYDVLVTLMNANDRRNDQRSAMLPRSRNKYPMMVSPKNAARKVPAAVEPHVPPRASSRPLAGREAEEGDVMDPEEDQRRLQAEWHRKVSLPAMKLRERPLVVVRSPGPDSSTGTFIQPVHMSKTRTRPSHDDIARLSSSDSGRQPLSPSSASFHSVQPLDRRSSLLRRLRQGALETLTLDQTLAGRRRSVRPEPLRLVPGAAAPPDNTLTSPSVSSVRSLPAFAFPAMPSPSVTVNSASGGMPTVSPTYSEKGTASSRFSVDHVRSSMTAKAPRSHAPRQRLPFSKPALFRPFQFGKKGGDSAVHSDKDLTLHAYDDPKVRERIRRFMSEKEFDEMIQHGFDNGDSVERDFTLRLTLTPHEVEKAERRAAELHSDTTFLTKGDSQEASLPSSERESMGSLAETSAKVPEAQRTSSSLTKSSSSVHAWDGVDFDVKISSDEVNVLKIDNALFAPITFDKWPRDFRV